MCPILKDITYYILETNIHIRPSRTKSETQPTLYLSCGSCEEVASTVQFGSLCHACCLSHLTSTECPGRVGATQMTKHNNNNNQVCTETTTLDTNKTYLPVGCQNGSGNILRFVRILLHSDCLRLWLCADVHCVKQNRKSCLEFYNNIQVSIL